MAATRTRALHRKISFTDRISRLTYHQACQLLSDDGPRLLAQGGQNFEVAPDEDVYLAGDLLRVRVRDESLPGGRAIVLLTQMTTRKRELHLTCDQCQVPCVHAGAALYLLLDNQLTLGLSAPPDESVPLELLTEKELIERALDERRQRARAEKMLLRSTNPSTPGTDYIVTSQVSGKATASRCRENSRDRPVAGVPTSTSTTWAPASTSCTPWRKCASGSALPNWPSLFAKPNRHCGWITAIRSASGSTCQKSPTNGCRKSPVRSPSRH